LMKMGEDALSLEPGLSNDDVVGDVGDVGGCSSDDLVESVPFLRRSRVDDRYLDPVSSELVKDRRLFVHRLV